MFHQGSSDAIFLYDDMLASALDEVFTFAGEVSFERKHRLLTKSEATPGDRFDLRMSRQFEEPCLLNERQATLFLISSLMKQVSKSPNTLTMSNDLISKFSKKNAENVD